MEFLAKNDSSSLAIILDFLGVYWIPVAKIKLKVTIDKGFNGQSWFDSPVPICEMLKVGSKLGEKVVELSCFDSPDMGDVERPKFEKFKEKVESSRRLKMISENYQNPIFFDINSLNLIFLAKIFALLKNRN